MKEIQLTHGKVALVDDENFEKLNQYKWHVTGGKRCLHAGRGGKYGKTVFMHHMVLPIPQGLFTDHIDGNGLNNQKSNLRICNSYQNAWNAKRRKDNITGFKGVSYDKKYKNFRAYIQANKKRYYLGSFNNPEDASVIYNQAAAKYHMEYVRKNTSKEKLIIENAGSFNWYLNRSSGFVASLAKTIQLADNKNIELLRKSYPQMIAAFKKPSWDMVPEEYENIYNAQHDFSDAVLDAELARL